MNPMKILLVDDSKSARYALRLQLQRHGALVETADSAEAALAQIEISQPDAVFMDHTMPGMNGFEALEVLKSAPETSHIPVVMCTSNEDPEFMAQARRKGALDILSKSTAPDKLQPLLHRLEAMIAVPPAAIAEPPPPPAPAPTAQPAEAPSHDAISELVLREATKAVDERLEESLRETLDPMVAQLKQDLAAELAADIENKLVARYQEEAQRLQKNFVQAQSEQAQLTTKRLVDELLPKIVHQHLEKASENTGQVVQAEIAKERQQVMQSVQGLIDASVDQLPGDPAFLRRVLDATEAAAASSAEQVVQREAHKIAEVVAIERAGEVAGSLIASARTAMSRMYLFAAAAAGTGVAAAALVFFLLR